MDTLITLAAGIAIGAIALVALRRVFRSGKSMAEHARIDVIAEQVRAVGRLIGLEVSAKEIATATKGFSWLPPLLLSQARVAMIFHFEKQYGVDLTRLRAQDLEDLGEGRYRIHLPPIEGSMRMVDVTPYDIQDGRVLGLLEVIPVNATTQKALMSKAQEQAAKLFETSDHRYEAEAQRSIERQLKSLQAMFGVQLDVAWRTSAPALAPQQSRSETPDPLSTA
ncbi:MAG: DUF4230 domain-containing protein [Phycisphaeraceae bacterium]|nr:DUF4230 domain-containing protein [Phycisphaeraceae bacterium]